MNYDLSIIATLYIYKQISLKKPSKMSIQLDMASLSPSEDLCILAAIYNNPDMTWY